MGKLINAVLILLIIIAVFHLNLGYYIVRGFHGGQNNEFMTVTLNESEVVTASVNETTPRVLTAIEKGQDALFNIAYHLDSMASQLPLNDVTSTLASVATAIVLIIVPLLILTHLIVSIAVR